MKMKNIALGVSILALSMMVGACQKTQTTSYGECRIHGTMESSQWDGKRIFLVPMFGPKDSAHVDSLVVEDGKFEFTVDSPAVKILRMDYHYRMGAQDLLVITEPGDVNVTIGGNSVGGGTPQNDSLQVWKDKLLYFNQEYGKLKAQAKLDGSDAILMTKGKEIQKALRDFNIEFARRQPEGMFKDYLYKMYSYIAKADSTATE